MTLIELVVTIAVISLVAAIAVPVFSNVLAGATEAAASDKQKIVDRFATDWTNGDYAVTQGTGIYDGATIAFQDLNGNGILDADEDVVAKVAGSLAASLAPTDIAVDATSGTTVNLSWAEPSYTGSVPVNHYQIQYSTSTDFTSGTTVVNTINDHVYTTLAGLTAGSTYSIRVAAATANSTGEFSTPIQVTMPTVANAPTGLELTAPTGTSIAATWTPPAFTGGVTLTGYRIQISTNPAFASATQTVDTATIATSKTLTGMTVGTTYYVKVAALNSLGASQYTPTGFISTATAPAAPTNLAVTVASATSLTANWAAPADNGGLDITGYRLTYATSDDFTTGVTVIDTGNPGLFRTITGLTTGTTYYVRVAALNPVGASPHTTGNANGTPAGTPLAPAAPTATLTGPTTATLDWAPAAANGSPVTSYTITSSPAGPVATITGTAATLTGLALATDYTFTITATNAYGASTSSAASNTITTATTAGTPTNLALTIASASSATATWTAPTTDGGTPITGYRVTYATTSDFTTGVRIIDTGATATSRTITGLTPGTIYYVRVAATNAAGTGTASTSATLTPDATPEAPLAAPEVAIATATSFTLAWTAPTANGTPITSYRIAVATNAAFTTGLRLIDTGTTGNSTMITSLTPGTTYYVTIAATNIFGTGDHSPTLTTTLDQVPAEMSAAPVLTSASTTSLTATWAEPANSGSPLSSYRIQYSTSPTFTSAVTVIDTAATALSLTITGLTPNATYYVRTAATNAAGTAPYSPSASLTTNVVPDAPNSPPTPNSQTPTSIALTAAAPTNAGTAITSYRLSYATTSDFTTGTVTLDTPSVSTLTALTTDTTYYVRYAATNSAGTGAYSPTLTVTLAQAAGTPAGAPALTAPTGKSLTATWNAPASGGAPTSYLITYSTSSTFATANTSINTGSTATTHTITGLTAGTTYYVKVAATNVNGTSAYGTSASLAPNQVPNAPASATSITLTALATVLQVNTAIATTGGTAVTSYRYQYSTASDFSANVITIDGAPGNTYITLNSLTTGTTYYVRSAATNTAGTGPYSAASSKSPDIIPGAPTAFTATTGTGSTVNVAWVAPVANGGTAITSYTVYYSTSPSFGSINTATFAAGATSGTISTLSGNTRYYFKVLAANAAGAGSFSTAANVTTNGVPGVPTSTSLVNNGTNSTVTFTWTAPINTGGLPITSYRITYYYSSSYLALDTGTAATTYTMTNLSPGTTWNMKVAATNAAGTGTSTAFATVALNAATMTTFAGTTAGYQDGTAATATFMSPHGMAADSAGNIYVADTGQNTIRKITPAGIVTTYAGSGTSGSANGAAATAKFRSPEGLAVDSAGNVYVADKGNYTIRKITPAGVVSTFAGTGFQGWANDSGTSAAFYGPHSLAFDAADNLYVTDSFRIRKITPAGFVTTIAGNGSNSSSAGYGTATSATVTNPTGIAINKATGAIYYVESGRRVQMISGGTVTTIAGQTGSGSGYTDTAGTGAKFSGAVGLGIDAAGNLYVADADNGKVRRIGSNDAAVTTVSDSTVLSGANGILATGGSVYVSEATGYKIRKITS